MLWRAFSALALLSTVVAQDITSDVRNPAVGASLGTHGGTATIETGVTYWLSGVGVHNVYGNVVNLGNIIFSQTDAGFPVGGQTSDWPSGENGVLQNAAGASIMLNDVSALSAPTYDWFLSSFVNNGIMQWCGRGDTGGSTYQLFCQNSCTNNGIIDFEQVLGNEGTAATWQNNVLVDAHTQATANIYNNGVFLMKSMFVHFNQNILGNGCWAIALGATMYLESGVGNFQNYQYGPPLPGQSIYFLDRTGELHIEPGVYLQNSSFGAQIYGFGTGNVITFSETISSLSYAANTGILTVGLSSSHSINLTLGPGYVRSSFTQGTYNGHFALFYTNAAPSQTVPTVCQVTLSACHNLQIATTVTSGYPGYVTTTTTQYGSGTAPATVIVETPTATHYSTVFQGYPGYVTTTLTSGSGYDQTLIVETPTATHYSTVSRGYPGYITTTITRGSGFDQTLVVETPTATHYSTVFQGYPGYVTTTVTSGSGFDQTLVVETPTATHYSTVFQGYPGYVTTTITSGTGFDQTLVVETPTATHYSTVFQGYPGYVTTTITSGSGFDQTLIVETPTATHFASTTQGYSGSVTTTITTGSGFDQTIIVETPTNLPTTTSAPTCAALGQACGALPCCGSQQTCHKNKAGKKVCAVVASIKPTSTSASTSFSSTSSSSSVVSSSSTSQSSSKSTTLSASQPSCAVIGSPCGSTPCCNGHVCHKNKKGKKVCVKSVKTSSSLAKTTSSQSSSSRSSSSSASTTSSSISKSKSTKPSKTTSSHSKTSTSTLPHATCAAKNQSCATLPCCKGHICHKTKTGKKLCKKPLCAVLGRSCATLPCCHHHVCHTQKNGQKKCIAKHSVLAAAPSTTI